MINLFHDFLNWTGSNNESGNQYGFWSGFGSDLAEFAIIGGMITLVRRHNCEVKGCWRLGRHTTLGNHHVCAKHHPDGAPTHKRVLQLHLKVKHKDDQ